MDTAIEGAAILLVTNDLNVDMVRMQAFWPPTPVTVVAVARRRRSNCPRMTVNVNTVKM